MIRINLQFFLSHTDRKPYPKEVSDWEFEDIIDGWWNFKVVDEEYAIACERAKVKFQIDKSAQFGEIHLIGYIRTGEDS